MAMRPTALHWPEAIGPGLSQPSPWPGATPRSAQERLEDFISKHLAGYAAAGDEQTSRLSAALKFGTISVRDVARAPSGAPPPTRAAGAGAERFVSQLCRRDYAHHLLHRQARLGVAASRQRPRRIGCDHRRGGAAWGEARDAGRSRLDEGMPSRLPNDGWAPDSVRRSWPPCWCGTSAPARR